MSKRTLSRPPQFRTIPSRFHPGGLAASLLAIALACFQLSAHSDEEVTLKTVEVRDGIYMVTGRGGNIGLSVGEDGTFVIDDQYAPLTDKILDAIAAITGQPVQFVINTHWHGDHTGGNENMAGAGALIVAHEHVRDRLKEGRPAVGGMNAIPGATGGALPVITYSRDITFHWNGETIDVLHVSPSHTDGDSFVIFNSANVVHTGDVFTNTGGYPFIDDHSGGKVRGFIDNARILLSLIDDDTIIIPGHGSLAKKADVETFLSLMETAVDRVGKLKAEGKTLEEVQSAKPLAEYDEDWGNGFISPDRFLEGIYNTL